VSHLTEDNPFNMVLRELWAMLEAHPKFSRDVKEGNRIRFTHDANRDPQKATVQAADMPEVTIFPETLDGNLHSTSSTTRVTRRYTVMVATGDFRYTEFLGPVEWYILCALLHWRTRLTSLQWAGKNFVKRVNAQSASQGVFNQQVNRNVTGWSALWRVEVEMHFDTDDLRAELTEGPVLTEG
jgi:hypothetical protein